MTREEREEAIKELIAFKDKSWDGMPEEVIDVAIEALKQEPCEDCISRQAVLDLLENTNNGWIINKVLQLPSVTPQPKMGRWIQTNEFFINQDGQFIYKFICSECKSLSYFRKSNKKAIGANVCPNCGAKMQEV